MRILRLLTSRPLPCGCLAGVYETYAGPIVWIVDAQDAACTDRRHRPGTQLPPGARPHLGEPFVAPAAGTAVRS